MSELQYCVFHISKYKEIGRIGSHIDRNNLQQTVERIERIDESSDHKFERTIRFSYRP